MRSVTPRVVIVAAAFLVACGGLRESGGARPSLQEIVASELARTMTPGAMVAVVAGDTLGLLVAYGRAEAGTDRALRADALFDAGGAVRLVNALTASSLAARGEIDLDRPVGEYVPTLPATLHPPTPAQLLSHTGGLVAEPALAGRADEAGLAEAIDNLTRHDRLTEPGTVYSVSAPGIALAAHAMERATGRPYEELVAEAVFRPLGMTRATVQSPGKTAVTPGHVPSREPTTPLKPAPVVPAGPLDVPVRGLYATARGLASLVRAIVNGGVVAGERRLPEAVVAGAFQPRVPQPGTGSVVTPGAILDTWEGRRRLRIDSSGGGHAVLIYVLPAEQIGVVVLTNSATGHLRRVPDVVFRRLLEARDAGRERAVADRPVPTADSGYARPPPRPLPAEALAGEYWNGGEGLELIAAGDDLRLRSGEMVLDVRWRDDAYRAVIPDGRTALGFQVLRDDRGRLYVWLADRDIALARDLPAED